MSEPVLVVTGVAGSGKTTLGKALAARLELPFFDADDYHPAANIRKMESGQPLTDADRELWLSRLREVIQNQLRDVGAVLACSALKQSYRDKLQGSDERVRFIYLDGTRELIQERLMTRTGHFMHPHLLQSQFDILEPPADALRVDASLSPSAQLTAVLNQLGRPVG
jgi:carbohydrate kinase (thermoresistant glucokinase family)